MEDVSSPYINNLIKFYYPYSKPYPCLTPYLKIPINVFFSFLYLIIPIP